METMEIAKSEFNRLASLTIRADEGFIRSRFFLCSFGDNDEQYSVSFEGNTAVFKAGRPRALLYAVYDYFSRAYGVKYFWDGERLPKKHSMLIKLCFSDKPRLKYRGLRYFAHRGLYRHHAELWCEDDWKREIDWIVKKRFNLFMLRTGDDDMFALAFACCREDEQYTSLDGFYDRTPFRTLRQRLNLREKIVAYARERDLIMPIDCGAITHWYSPTPKAFLDTYNPDFLTQSNSLYTNKQLLAFDIRKERNISYYLKLSDEYINRYGCDGLFHTIGLAERLYGSSREEDLALKKKFYSTLLKHISKKYPEAFLLIGSWDFAMSWSADEVNELLLELKASNAIIFDYVSDTTNEESNFTKWNLKNSFPHIFGIFHAYNPNTTIRGDYKLINKRISDIVDDSSCIGFVTWQELSHGDGFMLEFAARNAWLPCPLPLDYHIGRYCQERYSAYYKEACDIYSKLFEIAPLSQYRHERTNPERNIFRDYYLSLCPSEYGSSPDFLTINPSDIKRNSYFIPIYNKHKHNILPVLQGCFELFPFVKHDDMMVRDLFDVVKTAVSVYLHHEIMIFQNLYYRALEKKDSGTQAINQLTSIIETMVCFCEFIGTNEEYSLRASFKKLPNTTKTKQFFPTFLKNSVNDYCRAITYEGLLLLSIPEARATREYIYNRLQGNDTKESYLTELNNIKNDFYSLTEFKSSPYKKSQRCEKLEALINSMTLLH